MPAGGPMLSTSPPLDALMVETAPKIPLCSGVSGR